MYPSGVPIRDGEWTRLNFIQDEAIRDAYNNFWPSGRGQQNWDAIGKATIGGKDEWLLVEAKAHSAEIHSNGTTASEKGGRPMIRKAFKHTLLALGHDDASATQWAERWLTGYYQHANRLATLHFLARQGIAARLIFLYFCGDQHPDGKVCPATEAEWKPTLDMVEAGLGLQGRSELEQRVHKIFVGVSMTEDLCREA